MSPDKLVYMANQIAAFFLTQARDEAARNVAEHINSFWEPRMRRQLLAIADGPDSGLDPLVAEAVAFIRRPRENDSPIEGAAGSTVG